MAKNTFDKLNPSDLKTLSMQVVTAISLSPTTWGATATQVTNLTAKNTTLGTTITNAEATRVAAKAATQAQSAAVAAVVADLMLIAKQMYAKAGLTPEQIQSTGLAVHDSGKSTVNPLQVIKFTATPYADGQVEFSWKRNGNPYGVQFFIEASVDGGAWQQVYATKKQKIKLQGFTPGVPVIFRVVTANRNELSAPSLTASIYEEAAPTGLRIAA
ncbi:MAG: fibronectin type III domain-containing protein [Fimbriimonadaceae bacterium]